MPSQTEESKALLRRITDEIWNNGRLDLIDELISDDLVDHIDESGLEGTGPERYRASVTALRTAFPDYREEIIWLAKVTEPSRSYAPQAPTKGRCVGLLRQAVRSSSMRWEHFALHPDGQSNGGASRTQLGFCSN